MRWTDAAPSRRRRPAALGMVWVCAAAVLSAAGAVPAQTKGAAAAPPPSPAAPRFMVVLDAAHGGADAGAHLGTRLDEKALVLSLAQHLRSLLEEQGISVGMTRNADVDVSGDQRAQSMNEARAAACLSIHATAVGQGVHLFTSSLPADPTPAAPSDFVSWQTAQADHTEESLRLESALDTALTSAQVTVLMGRTALTPLQNATCPAVAVEIAPLDAQTPLTDGKYQQKVLDALVSALTAWRSEWRARP